MRNSVFAYRPIVKCLRVHCTQTLTVLQDPYCGTDLCLMAIIEHGKMMILKL